MLAIYNTATVCDQDDPLKCHFRLEGRWSFALRNDRRTRVRDYETLAMENFSMPTSAAEEEGKQIKSEREWNEI